MYASVGECWGSGSVSAFLNLNTDMEIRNARKSTENVFIAVKNVAVHYFMSIKHNYTAVKIFTLKQVYTKIVSFPCISTTKILSPSIVHSFLFNLLFCLLCV